MPRPPIPEGFWKVPSWFQIRDGDHFYNYILGRWTPCTFSVGARVDYWGLTVIRSNQVDWARWNKFSEFVTAVRKASISLDEARRVFNEASPIASVEGEARIWNCVHYSYGKGTEALR